MPVQAISSLPVEMLYCPEAGLAVLIVVHRAIAFHPVPAAELKVEALARGPIREATTARH
jgi:hypothetical protein